MVIRPYFSLVTATLDGYKRISGLLNSLKFQNFKSFELIIVDQSEDTKKLVNTVEVSGLKNVKIINTKLKHLSKARNLGINVAKRKIIGFPDDDLTYAPDFLGRVKTKFEKNDIFYLSCCVRESKSKKKLPISPISYDKEITTIDIFRLVTSAGLFIKNENIKFDTMFGIGAKYGSCEEIDLAMRLKRKKKRGRYYPQLAVYHPPIKPVKFQNKAKIISRSIGHGGLWAKHFDHYLNEFVIIVPISYVFLKPLANIVKNSYNLDNFNTCLIIFLSTIKGFITYIKDDFNQS